MNLLTACLILLISSSVISLFSAPSTFVCGDHDSSVLVGVIMQAIAGRSMFNGFSCDPGIRSVVCRFGLAGDTFSSSSSSSSYYSSSSDTGTTRTGLRQFELSDGIGYESEFTRIHPYVLHFDPGPLLLSFTLEFNSDKHTPFMVTIFLQNINYAK